MPNLVETTNLQTLEYDVTTAEGAARVTVVTGALSANLGTPANSQQNLMLKALVGPKLAPGQFRKATATVSFQTVSISYPTQLALAQWRILDAQATFDDENSSVQLIVETLLTCNGTSTTSGGSVNASGILFQVTILAMVGTGPVPVA